MLNVEDWEPEFDDDALPSNIKYDPTKWTDDYCLTEEASSEVDAIVRQWVIDDDDEKMFDALETYMTPYSLFDIYVRNRLDCACLEKEEKIDDK